MKALLLMSIGVSVAGTSVAIAEPLRLAAHQLNGITAGMPAEQPVQDPGEAISEAVQEIIFPLLESGGELTASFLTDPDVQAACVRTREWLLRWSTCS